MTDTKISQLPELTTTMAEDDLLVHLTAAGPVDKITLANERSAVITGALSTLATSNLTASRALVSNSAGKVAVSSVTSAELAYLAGLTANAQGRLNNIGAKHVKNLLVNGNFDLWDKGTSFNGDTDDVYRLPRWNWLEENNGDGDTITQQASGTPDGSRYYLRLSHPPTGLARHSGLVQFIEAQNAIPLAGKNISLSFQARVSSVTDSPNVRAAVLSWSSTADTLTSDVVSAWNDTPTLAANWTAENTPANLGLTASWQTFTINNIAIDTASMANVAVFIWFIMPVSADTLTYDVTQVQLEIGATATTFVPRLVSQERKMARRTYYRVSGDGSGNGLAISQDAKLGTNKIKNWVAFPEEMRTAPTATVSGTWALTNCTGPTVENLSKDGFGLTATASGAGMVLIAPNSIDDYIEFDCEL